MISRSEKTVELKSPREFAKCNLDQKVARGPFTASNGETEAFMIASDLEKAARNKSSIAPSSTAWATNAQPLSDSCFSSWLLKFFMGVGKQGYSLFRLDAG